MTQKFPIGSRVGAKVATGTYPGMTHSEAALRVVGYDGLKGVIVQFLEAKGIWEKDQVTIMPAKNLSPREEVTHIHGEPEGEDGAAIGWMEMGGLSVALTRDRDGALLISFERAVDYPREHDVTVRVRRMPGSEDLWEGDIT